MQRPAAAVGALVLVLGCADTAGQDTAERRPTPEQVDPGWLTSVQRGVEARGRQFRASAPGAFEARSRLQRYRARLDRDGLALWSEHGTASSLLTRSDGVWSLDLRFSAWGIDGELQPLEVVAPVIGTCPDGDDLDVEGACVRRLEYQRSGVTEWWRNGPEGLQQGWTVDALPGDGTELVLVLDVAGGAVVAADGRSARLASGRVEYGELRAWDARGKALPASMEARQGGLALRIGVAGAELPVVVDPLLTVEAAQIDGDGAGDELGYSVASAGDVNGDGYGDLVVGAPDDDNNGADSGSAFVYLGSATGMAGGSASTAAHAVIEGDGAGDGFGHWVSSAGDTNGDGFGDLVVGAPWDDDNGSDSGAAFVFFGSASGIVGGSARTTADAVLDGDGAGDHLGCSLSSAGSVNGDAFGDLVVGADGGSSNGASSGLAFVFVGSASGVAGGVASAVAQAVLDGDGAGDRLGCSVSSAGDIDGDGFGDLVVGAWGDDESADDSGSAFVFLGSSSGIPSGDASAAAHAVLIGGGVDDHFGWAVTSAGDVDGDGYADLAVGAPHADDNSLDSGSAFVFLGSASGIVGGMASAAAHAVLVGDGAGDYFGSPLASAGDINGDGYGDLAVGARRDDDGGLDSGSALVFLGSASGMAGGEASTVAHAVLPGDGAGDGFGVVSSAGDVNGDGFGDLVVGAPLDDEGGTDSGSVALYLGAGSGIQAGSASAVAQAGLDGDGGATTSGTRSLRRETSTGMASATS